MIQDLDPPGAVFNTSSKIGLALVGYGWLIRKVSSDNL